MARGDVQRLSRRQRAKVDQARIAAKVAALPELVVREGVMPLNPDFFKLEGARYARVAKKAGQAPRAKLRE